ncbi:MAG: AAA family ATPase [Spirochaetales bacterium]|nr:AAA family ATPase [Spirochaetales bacterium]MCF7937128.1 AAA family ATPase [Spirochaetales bacterium]
MSNKSTPSIIIAISGKSGCGNSTVSRVVAERLGLHVVNYTFHTIADEQGISFDQLRELAETDPSWDRYLDTRQVEMASKGNCVLGSRLAIWMMKDADLKIFLDASLEVRAKRIQQREGGDLEAVREKTRERDQRDHDRYLKLYGIDNNRYRETADLVIDTEKNNIEQTAQIVIDAVRKL